MFGGDRHPPVDVPCPLCHQVPNTIVFLYFTTATLFCARCEWSWDVEPSDPAWDALPKIMSAKDRVES